MISDEEYAYVENVISELCEESYGSRGHFYEKYGSAIQFSLLPLIAALESLLKTDPEKALNLAVSLYE